jgi:hypothetical protein
MWTCAVTNRGRICQRLDLVRQTADVNVGNEPSEGSPPSSVTSYGLTVIETMDLLDLVGWGRVRRA